MPEITTFNVVSRIKSLDMISFKTEKRDTDRLIEPDKITFDISANFSVNESEKLIAIVNQINIFSDPTKNELLGSIEVKGEFVLENMDDLKQPAGLPTQLVAMFLGVVVSSSRGILRILSKGTAFETAIIPIVNPMAFLENLKARPTG